MPSLAGARVLRILIVAAAYLATGRAALLLALPPGYATAVWPPTGIALAAAILWGPAVLPGVWLGSLGVDLLLGTPPLQASAIALGAVAQAFAGAWIVRRVAGPGNPLDEGRSALRALFIAGPASCLLGASNAVPILVWTGRIPAEEAPYTWAVWWAADLIGVLVFLPPLLAWTARPREFWRRRRWSLAGPLLACFAAVVAFFVYARTIEERRESNEFDDRQRPLAEAIQRNLTRAADTVVALGSFFDSSETVTRQEFAVFTAPSLRLGLGLRALSWNPIVGPDRRGGSLAGMRDEGLGGVAMTELGPGRGFVAARERPWYASILYIEPAAENDYMIGFDIASEPARRAAVEAAVDRAAPTATTPIRLVQRSGESLGLLLMMPVYEAPDPPAEVDERRATVLGVVVGALSMEDLVADAIEGLGARGLAIRVRDLGCPPGEQLLYGEDPRSPEPLSAARVLEDAGRLWRIEIAHVGRPERAWSTWFVLAGGLLVVALLGAIVIELSTRSIHVERLVTDRTRELAQANEELQHKNIELQRFTHVASHDLREPLRAIGSYAQLLEESAGSLTKEQRGFLSRITGGARRMHGLVDDLLALARMEDRTRVPSPTRLRSLVDLARENLQTAIEASQARIEVGELPTVLCDPSQIVQLFQNLIANGIKFSRDGVRPEIRIESGPAGAFHEISIRDNGIGIVPEDRARVFEMFRRLHGRERYGGTGMGLAICRKVVERHGGRIWVESAPQGGCVFRFTLPAERSPG